jgi:gliding motility-associated-like protein
MLYCIDSVAQIGYGQAVYLQDFGIGDNDPATIGTPLSPDKSEFTFSNSTCPPPGSYTIMRRIPVLSCFNKEWIDLSHDNNPFIPFGMMMVVNNNSSVNNRIVFKDTIAAAMCPGEIYNCSVALINLDTIGICPSGPDFPVFELRLETETGTLITKDTTRPGIIFANPPPFGFKFSDLGFYFIMPGGVNKLVIKLTLLHSIYECAEDFAIDDFIIRPVGPAVAIGFAGEPTTTIVKSVCYQDNKTIVLNGNMDNYYPNPVLQWQLSKDSGTTWIDISGANSTTYSKSFSTPDTFLYRLSGGDVTTISNPNCRVISNIIKVNVDGLPSNFTITNNSPVCAGQDLKFNAGGAASYIWTGPNGFYDNIPFPHIFFSSLKDSGMYYVEVFSLGGCHLKDSTRVTIIGTDVHAGPDSAICKGHSVQLHASGGINYSWSPSNGLSNTTVGNPIAKPGETTEYTVKVTDKDGCSDTAHVKIAVINKNEVKAVISANGYLCRSYDSVYFASNSLGDIKKWFWDFGNGQTSLLPNPPVQNYQVPENKNNYLVKLTITDTAGCTDITSHTLNVVDNCYIAVPSGFTPNNDGLNDFLSPLNAYKATNLLFRVYNRFGQIVFQTRDWMRKWDGTIGGLPQNSGVYVWMLDYYDTKGKRVSLKGTTVLIR